MTDYAGNGGTDQTGNAGWAIYGNGLDGTIVRRPDGTASRSESVTNTDIRDGTSNTLLFGEKALDRGRLGQWQPNDDVAVMWKVGTSTPSAGAIFRRYSTGTTPPVRRPMREHRLLFAVVCRVRLVPYRGLQCRFRGRPPTRDQLQHQPECFHESCPPATTARFTMPIRTDDRLRQRWRCCLAACCAALLLLAGCGKGDPGITPVYDWTTWKQG